MTFLALPAWAAWTLLCAALAAAVAAFFIPPRRITHIVPSLVVWLPLVEPDGAASIWARLRRAVSLLLTAVIAGALALAIAQPMNAGRGATGRVLLVLDSSWSMRARTAAGHTRWDLAVATARDVLAGVGGREVALATTAEGIIEGPTRDLARLGRIVERLEPSGAQEAAWPRLADAGEVHFFTDGATARVTEAGVDVHSVFVPAANVAVTAFAVAPTTTAADRAEAYVAVANFAETPQPVRVVVTRAAAVIASRSIDVPAGETYRDVISVPTSGDPRFRVHITARENALDIDDDAVAWLWAAEPLRVGIVSTSPVLAALLAKDPGVRGVTVPAAAYPTTTADVWVFDQWLPASPPAAPALLIAPPSASWAGTIQHEEPGPRWRAGGAHALLDGVDAHLIQMRTAAAFDRPALRAVATSEIGTPLVSVEDSPAGRYVVLGFSLAESNLASTPAFPVLIGNAIDWLGRPERGAHRSPGPVLLPAATTRVTSPTGQSVSVRRVGDHVTATFREPGVYLVEAPGARRVMTVGLDDPGRSNLQVSRVSAVTPRQATPATATRPWWRVAAWVALALGAIEWMTWLKRVTV